MTEKSTVTKKELIELLASKLRVPRDKASLVLDAVVQTLSECLEQKREIRFGNCGTFKPGEYKERVGVNPKTLQKIAIPSRKGVQFKPSTALKERLNHKR